MKLRFASLLLLAVCLVSAIPTMASVVYTNGPVDGQTQAYTINFGFSVSDSFVVSSATTITGFDFAAWVFPGDTPVSVDWAIGTSFFGSDVASGTASLSNAFLFNNGSYDVYTSTASGLNVAVGPGTYYLTLLNAVTAQSNPMYWDQNSGPSAAMDSALGSIPSETFTIYGGGSGVPEPGTLVMMGSGVLGMAGLLRRKLNF